MVPIRRNNFQAVLAGRRVGPIFAAAGAGWLALVALQYGLAPATAVHGPPGMNHPAPALAPVTFTLLHWAAMTGAMMLPLLIPAADYVAVRSFGHRRTRAQAMLIAGFVGAWSAAGLLLVPLQLPQSALPGGTWLVPALAALTASAWQLSETRLLQFRRCHATLSLRPAGLAADWDCLRFGVREGLSCCRTCLPAMLAMMLLPAPHLFALPMSLLLLREHFERLPNGRALAVLLLTGALLGLFRAS